RALQAGRALAGHHLRVRPGGRHGAQPAGLQHARPLRRRAVAGRGGGPLAHPRARPGADRAPRHRPRRLRYHRRDRYHGRHRAARRAPHDVGRPDRPGGDAARARHDGRHAAPLGALHRVRALRRLPGGRGLMGVDAGSYMSSLESAVDFHDDVLGSLLKALIFGVLVGLIATYRGHTTAPTSAGVGAATTSTVVVASVSILIFDYFITALWGV